MEKSVDDPGSPFARLPMEILSDVLRLIPDLVTLAAFIEADAVVRRYFNNHAADITEHVMDHSLPSQIKHLICISALVRAPRAAGAHIFGNCLDDFCRSHLANYSIQRNQPRQTPSTIVSLSPVPVDVLRAVIVTAREIYKLTCCCLQSLLQQASTLRVMHLQDKSFRYRHRGIDWTIPDHQLQLADYEFTPHEAEVTAPPSCVELSRVTRACWRIQLLRDLQQAGRNGTLLSFWSPEEISQLINIDAGYYRLPVVADPELEETKTVARCVKQLSRSDVKSVTLAPEYWPTASYIQLETLSRKISIVSPGVSFATGPLVKTPWSPLRRITFDPFIAWGLAIWDEARLTALGLWVTSKQEYLIWESNLFYAWRSIIGKDTLQILKEIR